MAGGVAFNSVMNGKIPLRTPFREVYIQAAAGDSGTAVGACFHIYNVLFGHPRSFVMEHAYTGPEFVNGQIERVVRESGLKFQKFENHELTRVAAKAIADGNIVGWFQGRMEFGPRALGNRSIVVDPRRADMKDSLNARIRNASRFVPSRRPYSRTRSASTSSTPILRQPCSWPTRSRKRASLVLAVTHVDGQAGCRRYLGIPIPLLSADQ